MVVQEGVSRTVVREAISRLQAGGFVETRHGIGSFVLGPLADGLNFKLDATALLTIQDLLAMLELRISLESQAAGLAAARRSEEHLVEMRRALATYEENIATGRDTIEPDFDFHLRIANATGNRYFADIMSRLGTATITRSRLRLATSDLTAYLRGIHGQHEAVYRAILSRDPEAAQTMMRVHLTASREELAHYSGERGDSR
jgi:GntR family transcriptional repressor for pyruvate dehydrogenase complex